MTSMRNRIETKISDLNFCSFSIWNDGKLKKVSALNLKFEDENSNSRVRSSTTRGLAWCLKSNVQQACFDGMLRSLRRKERKNKFKTNQLRLDIGSVN